MMFEVGSGAAVGSGEAVGSGVAVGAVVGVGVSMMMSALPSSMGFDTETYFEKTYPILSSSLTLVQSPSMAMMRSLVPLG